MRGFKEAQAAYDEMEPPEEKNPAECPECKGSGSVTWGPDDEVEECPLCGGEGSL